MIEDAELLRRYAEEKSEDAFAELVRRHVNLVHSAALRQVNGDAHLAADVTQVVFTDVARKAAVLAQHRVLAGWLFTSTRFTAAKAVRTERRRAARELEAQLMQDLSQDSAAALDWDRVRPVLDEALGELSEDDREAILLRFFENRDFNAVGAQLGLTANTARMRVERALEKLRTLLGRRGLASTTAALAASLGAQAVTAAPAGLASTVTGAALAGAGTTAAVATFMSMSKLQIGIAAALAVAGTAGFVIQEKSNAVLRREVAALQVSVRESAALQQENLRLARTAVEVEELRKDDTALAQLRDEANALKAQAQKLAAAKASVAAAAAAVRERIAAAGGAPGQTLEVARMDGLPVAKFQVRPQYPPSLRGSGLSGEATVTFIVDAQGNVQNAKAIKSTHDAFGEAAEQTISKWKWIPAQKGTRSVNSVMEMAITFSVPKEDVNRAEITWTNPTPGNATIKKPAPPDWF